MRKSVFRRNSPTDGSPKAEHEDAVTEESDTAEAVEADGVDDALSGEDENTADEELSVVADGAADDPSSDAAAQAELIARLEAEVKENYDKYLRALAEMENTKKRALRERADLIRYAGEHLARDLLEIADNFQLAFAQDLSGVPEQFVQGFRLISDRFVEILAKFEVKPESALGTPFDPNKQQALTSVPTADHPPGTVIEEFKKAYFFKDKLLRPGQVVVSVAPPEPKSVEGSAAE